MVVGDVSTGLELEERKPVAAPAGLGSWDRLFYLLPFLGVGFLWFKAVKRKRDGKPLPVSAGS
jgi:hypothetical protein